MHLRGAGKRGAVTDLCVVDDEGGVVPILARGFEGGGDGAHVLAVFDHLDLPAVSGKARGDILAERNIGRALDRDAVAVIHGDELAKAQRARQGGSFGGRAFHHAAVAHDGIGIVVDDRIAGTVKNGGQVGFRHGHADRHGKALAERPGRRFDADGMPVLRVARRAAAVLTEIHEIIDGQSVPEQVQQRIFEHRGVAGREHETVARRPVRIFRIVLHLLPKRESGGGAANGKARMAAIGALYRLGGEHAHRRNGKPVVLHLFPLHHLNEILYNL